MMSLREDLKQRAREAGLSPNRSRGQRFLADRVVLHKIIVAADLKKMDTVLEIGPGLGALTDELIKHARHVYAVDIDAQVTDYLQQRYCNSKNITIENKDALHYELPVTSYQLLSNLPYEITTPFLWRYCLELEPAQRPQKMVLLMQREVAERILVREPPFNPLALLVAWFGDAHRTCNVSRHAFWPEPRVEGAVVVIEQRVHIQESKNLFAFIRAGFAHPRRTLAKNLALAGYSAETVKEALESIDVPLNIRAERLSLFQWQKFSLFL